MSWVHVLSCRWDVLRADRASRHGIALGEFDLTSPVAANLYMQNCEKVISDTAQLNPAKYQTVLLRIYELEPISIVYIDDDDDDNYHQQNTNANSSTGLIQEA